MTSPMERTATFADSRSTVIGAATIAIVVGFFLVFAAGFVHPEALHNAVHDARHSLAFPCH
jgi:cobalt transporter subunit CbtB